MSVVASGRSRSTPRPDRWWRHVRPGEKLPCPRGHQLPFPVQRSAGPIQCTHPVADGRHSMSRSTVACGAWVYVARALDLGTFVVAVDDPEIAAIDLCRTPDEVFAFLEVWPK